VLQFGGAAGTLAALGERGIDVARRLAAELDLGLPDLPWHTERDRPASVVAALGVTAGLLAKIASDIVFLAETDVAEVAERTEAGKGVSSAMPQKRNPVDAIAAIAAARLAIGTVPVVLAAMTQEHERGAGGWQAEWTAIPDAFRHTLRAAAGLRRAVADLQVDSERMRANLTDGQGAIMAESLTTTLAETVGLAEARSMVGTLVARCAADGVPFDMVAKDDDRVTRALTPEALDRALDPMAYLGSANQFIDRALESWRHATGGAV
jgi:3-carboxy-cis,cis-muconate cycloisomerase